MLLYEKLDNASQQLSTISLATGKDSSVVDADLLRCESEEQLLEASNDIGNYFFVT